MEIDLSAETLWTLGQVILIDIVLAGDNAIVVGLAAAGLAPEQRRKAIIIGVVAAMVLRIAFAVVATQLLAIIGLMFAGGLLLLWVAWKLWRELGEIETALGESEAQKLAEGAEPPRKEFKAAVIQIIIADVSMSLDNVLAVAGAARDHPVILVFGLVLSVALMGAAAALIARLLVKYRWLSFVGVAIIVYVGFAMMWEGAQDIMTAVNEPPIEAAD